MKIKHSIVTLFTLTIIFTFSFLAKAQSNAINTDKVWIQMNKVITSMKPTQFKNKVYNILDFGAKADGTFNCTEAFKKAIAACSKNGGGKVLVPNGKFFTGPIHLESNVNLHLEDKAEILFSTNPNDYYPLVHTSFEATELMNYSPLIYAYKKTNIAVTGKGTLNGQASNDNWWSWCGKDEYGWKQGMPSQNDPLNRFRLVDMAEKNIPVKERVFGNNGYLRPNFIQFFECKNTLIQDVTITNAPFWIIHPIKSTNVVVDGVTVRSHGPNNDGCDPEYSKNVWIKNCIFDTGDDCIAIKAGRDADGRRVGIKSENIIVQNCKMYDGHGGVTIGSEISAGVSNVYVENCLMDSPNLDRAIRIKTNAKRGGLIENIHVRNLQVGQVKEAVLRVDMFYSVYKGDNEGPFIPRVENITLENVQVKDGGKYGILAKGYATSPVKNILFKNVTIDKVGKTFQLEHVENLRFIETKINGEVIKENNNNKL
nr:glycoside hydrolase family 28 protein [uncultured Flavobacterium sp.]